MHGHTHPVSVDAVADRGGRVAGACAWGRPGARFATWTGRWADLSFGGEFHLTQNGTSVTGTYSFCNGSITGTVTGNTLNGTWNQADPGCNPTGWFPFTLNAAGSEFSGVWGYPETPPSTPAGTWSGRCAADCKTVRPLRLRVRGRLRRAVASSRSIRRTRPERCGWIRATRSLTPWIRAIRRSREGGRRSRG